MSVSDIGLNGNLSRHEPMASLVDIYRSASILLNKFGEDATVEAAMRADAKLELGDMEGCAVWKKILKAVKELQSTTPDDGAVVH